jgi:hypothetical protein
MSTALGGRILLTLRSPQPPPQLTQSHIHLTKLGTGTLIEKKVQYCFHSVQSVSSHHITDLSLTQSLSSISGDIVALIPEEDDNNGDNNNNNNNLCLSLLSLSCEKPKSAREENERRHESGVVARVWQNKIQVMLSGAKTEVPLRSVAMSTTQQHYTLTLLVNEVTYKRMNAALTRLEHNDVGSATRVVNVLLGITPPASVVHSAPSSSSLQPPTTLTTSLVPFNPTLNPSQLEAVKFALNSLG